MHSSQVLQGLVSNIYTAVGSSLGHVTGDNIRVWGTGFLSSSDVLRISPASIYAVRGFKSLSKIPRRFGEEKIAVGDPALLMPMLYTSDKPKTFSIGIVPHFREQDLPIFQNLNDRSTCKIIDILGDIESVCDEINQCRTIVSSSLHGAIAAHAYGIPARLISVSNRPLGDGFKYLDYLSSVGLEEAGLKKCVNVDDVLAASDEATLPVVLPDLRKLIESCPFIATDVREVLLSNLATAYSWYN